MFAAQFLSGVGFSFVLPFFPFYFRALGIENIKDNLLWVGWASAAFGVTMAFTAPLWGLVADRYGRKLMVVRSMIGGSVVLGLMGFATKPWHLVALRILQGVFTGTVAASITLVSSITPAANRGISLGILQTGFFLGTSIGPFAGGILADRFGFRVPCYAAFAMLFIGTVLVIFFASERFVPPERTSDSGFRTIGKIVNMHGFKFILSLYFLLYVLNSMVIPILPLFIEQLLGTTDKSASLTGIFVAFTGFLAGISSVFLGRLGDRFGPERILMFSLVCTGLITIPQSFAGNLVVLFIERCLLGLAFGGILPSVNTLVSYIIPQEKIGGAYGMTTSVTSLGIGAGPLIGGYLASLMGLRVPFAVLGIMAIIVAYFVHATFGKLRKESV